MTELIWSFSPWLAFLIGARAGSLYGAVAAGVGVAVVVTGRAIMRRRLHLLDAAGLCYFLALGAVLIIIHPGHLDYWSRYAQAASHAALTLIVFGSILLAHPFTESYAREKTPAAFWTTPEFHAINRRISTVWGLAFLAGTISLIAAGSTGDRQILLRIIIPFGALYLAYRYTQKQTGQTRNPAPATTGAAASGGSSQDASSRQAPAALLTGTASQDEHNGMSFDNRPDVSPSTTTPASGPVDESGG